MVVLDVPQGANAALKFIPQLAGQGGVTVTEDELDAVMKGIPTDEDVVLPSRSDVVEAVLVKRCGEHYQAMFSQSSERQAPE